MKQKVVLLVAVLVGLLAFFMSHQYLKGEREKLYKGAEKIEVIVAAVELVPGTVLKTEDLGFKSVFKSQVDSQVILKPDVPDILEKKLLVGRRKGEPLMMYHIDQPPTAKRGLSSTIRTGMRAVSLSIGGVQAVSGLVQPNDRVDILGTFTFPSRTPQPQGQAQMETVTMTLLQDVTVIATGTRTAKQVSYGPDPRATGYNTVTFEVTPQEAEMLVFTENMKGSLTLVLRNSEDVYYKADLPEIDFKYLEKEIKNLNIYRQTKIRQNREM